MNDVADLALARRLSGGPADMRLTMEFYRLSDGRVYTESKVEEYRLKDTPGLPLEWIRHQLRDSILAYSRIWRLGLKHRRNVG